MAEAGLRVLDPGRSCVQDAGRRGQQQYGVSVRGSSDQYSAAMACALVANDITAPLIEVTALGLAVEVFAVAVHHFSCVRRLVHHCIDILHSEVRQDEFQVCYGLAGTPRR